MKISKIAALAVAVLLGASTALAVPAKREYRTYTLADGTEVRAMKVGDEFGHYYVSEAGVTMLGRNDGRLVAAGRESVEAVMKQAEKRRANTFRVAPQTEDTGSKYHGLGHFSAPFPRKGKAKSLVFLVEYTDVKFSISDPKAYFTRQLNEPGFREDGAMGSARDYFLQQSQGEFDPEFEVYGPVQLKNRMAYYGAMNDLKAPEMVIEAAAALDDEIDFSKYDLDGNGKIDNVFVIYAGFGEADYDDASTVWPHAYELYEDYYGIIKHDGKQLYGYACANELTPTDFGSRPNGIATFCHEFSHVLGLPDLYNVNYPSDLTTPNAWDLMDYGSYNNDGCTPPNYSAVERNAMGWMYPRELAGPEAIVLESLSTSNNAYIIPTDLDNEFFVVENRQQDSWDTYLPGHGLLVWHICFNQTKWDNNTPNVQERGTNIGVDIVEAGGIADASVDYNYRPLYLDSYTFPGTRNITSLTATTSPALRTWAGLPVDFPITDIVEANGVVSFDVCGGVFEFGEIAAPVLSAANDATITVKWTQHPKALDYQLSVTCDGRPYREYTDFNTGNVSEYVIKDVEGERDYAVRVRAVNGRQYSDYSPEATVTTPATDFIYLAPTATGASREGSRATLSWLPLAGAESYALTVECEADGGSSVEKHDFGSNDKLKIPEGWIWSGSSSDMYKSTTTPKALVVSGAPVLKFARNQASLTSGMYESEITSLSFWLVANSTSANVKSVFDVLARAGVNDGWTIVKTIDNVHDYDLDGATVTVDVPAGMHQLKFVYTKPQSGGNVGLDNIEVGTVSRSYSKILDRHNVGDVTDYTVDVPAEATALRFYVEGVDALGRYSRQSNVLAADLSSGIGEVGDPGVSVTVSGHSMVYSGNAGDCVAVVNLYGVTVATAVADATGKAAVDLPGQGIFIVTTPSASRKIVVK